MSRIFSGIQPSGDLHIGNYLGAVKNWVELQLEHECFICIVDYHAITQPYDISKLAQKSIEMGIGLLAAGIDPEKSVLFIQSHVHQHTELGWVFTTVTPTGALERMTQFKDKAQRQESILAGLLNYPVLQAADVLLYKADMVPVGEDQVQHVELMREIARKWNAKYCADFFPEPAARVGDAKRVLGLDGQAKMSKSLGNTVGILDEPAEIWNRIRPARTDPARVKRDDPGTPEVCNVFAFHQHFSSTAEIDDVATKCRTAGWGCIDCKRMLSDNIATTFAPMRNRASTLRENPSQMADILAAGAEKAAGVAADTMMGVRSHMGLAPMGASLAAKHA